MVISMLLRNCHTSLEAPMPTANFSCLCVGKIVKGVNIQRIHPGSSFQPSTPGGIIAGCSLYKASLYIRIFS